VRVLLIRLYLPVAVRPAQRLSVCTALFLRGGVLGASLDRTGGSDLPSRRGFLLSPRLSVPVVFGGTGLVALILLGSRALQGPRRECYSGG
jgi:hypothetical protein